MNGACGPRPAIHECRLCGTPRRGPFIGDVCAACFYLSDDAAEIVEEKLIDSLFDDC